MEVISVGAIVLLISFLAPAWFKPLLRRLGVVDIPNARSSHVVPTIRGMGIAPLLAFVVGVALLILGADRSSRVILAIILIVAAAAAIVGWIEDYRGLPIVARAGAQVFIGLVGAGALVAALGASWFWVPIFGIAVGAYVNVANFMDGINGISSLHGLVVGTAYGILGLIANQLWLTGVGLILAVAFIGFLPWNLIRSGVFLGDVGSYLLGASVASIGVAGLLVGIPVVVILGPLAIYLADTAMTFCRRVTRGDRWFESHRNHIYQQLTAGLMTHVQGALVVSVASALTFAAGLLVFLPVPGANIIAWLAMAMVVVAYLALPKFLRVSDRKFEQTSSAPASDLPQEGLRAEKWAVLGATGFIGSALVDQLVGEGHEVVSIKSPRLDLDPSSDENTLLDIEDIDSISDLKNSLRGIDVLVNAAGVATPDAAATASLFGANALLPVVAYRAAGDAGVQRFVHISSAAVQGRRSQLDESATLSPFSAYSRSKALAESALMALISRTAGDSFPELVIVRATSVQGASRPTTQRLAQVAGSRLASVARPGDLPTVVSSVRGLVEFVSQVGGHSTSIPTIVLQPYEGVTTSEVLEFAGNRSPKQLPALFCRSMIVCGYAVSAVVPKLSGIVRRVEVMWFGQQQDAAWARANGLDGHSYVEEIFKSLKAR